MKLNTLPVSLVCCLTIICFCFNAGSQSVGINPSGAAPHSSAMLDVSSNDKGFLPPRMTWAQIQAIPNPATGLIVYDIGLKAIRLYNGSSWVVLSERVESFSDGPGNFTAIPTGGNGFIGVQDMYIRADKSVGIVGYVSANASIGSYNFTPSGVDIFMALLDSVGNVTWAQMLGSTGSDNALGVTFDASNNMYVCGSFQGTVDFDPGVGIQNLTVLAGTDGFYAKYTNSGALVWAKRTGAQATEIVTDGTNVIVGGVFAGTRNFNPTSLTAFGGNDIFLAKYQASDGNIGTGFAIHIGSSTGNESLSNLKLYGGNPILCGSFEGVCDFNGMTRTSNGNTDGFYATYNSFGGVASVTQIGGASNDNIAGIASDASGNVYITGYFYLTVDFDPGAGTQNRTSAGASDLFVAKYNSGGAFVYVRTFGGVTDESPIDHYFEIDNNSNLYLMGFFNFSASFFPFSFTTYGSFDVALVKLNSSGTILWAQQAGGTNLDSPGGLSVSADGKLIYTSVYYSGLPGLNFKKIRTYKSFDIMRYEE